MAFRYFNWEEVLLNWENVDMNWEEVGVLEQLAASGGIYPSPTKDKFAYKLEKINKLSKDKKRILIKLVCKIEGKEFEEYKYKNEDINITAEHMDIITEKMSNNLKINVQNIS